MVIDSYRKEELGEILRRFRPDLGLLLSTVPETFSYTLSELQAAGIPTVASRLGAFVERILHGETGWLVAPNVSSVAEQILELRDDRSQLEHVRQRLKTLSLRSVEQMVGDYIELLPLYTQVAKERPKHSALMAMSSEGPLLVDPEARFMDALWAFYRYALRKASLSPRIPAALRARIGRG
jgi:hypothetical protein